MILPPIASPDTYSIAEDGSLIVSARGVLANDHDPASKALTAVLVSDVSNGSLSLSSDGSFTYTPNALFSGADSFTYKANDGSRDSNTVIVTITVNHVNHPPTGMDDSYTTAEDTILNVALDKSVLKNDSDVDVHDHLSAIKLTEPAHGVVVWDSNNNGTFTYTPSANYNGTDSFTYKANDGSADSSPVTVSLIVTPVNDAPVAADDSYTIAEDRILKNVVSVLSNDRDPEANHLTAIKVTDPVHGIVTLQPDGFFTYTPNTNFNGKDSFTYTANDGQLDSHIATVHIIVTPVNDPPVANADGYSVHEDTGLKIDAKRGVRDNDTDAELNGLTVILDQNAAHGTLHLNKNGSFSYTPNINFNGLDSFTYHVNDGHSNSNIVTVTLTVDAINDKPVAVPDLYSIPEDTVLQVVFAHGLLQNDSDIDGDILTVTPVSQPANGTLHLNNDGSFTYMPDSDFNGVDSFEYKASDGMLDSDPVTVSINVSPVNDAPLATGDSYNTPEDASLIINVANGILTNDSDPDHNQLHVMLVPGGGPTNGTIHVDTFTGSFTYIPDSNFNGIDSFTYWASDGQLQSNIATVSINVHAVNDAPVAMADGYSVGENGFLNVPLNLGILINDYDIDGNTLHVKLGATQVTGGTLHMNTDGSFSYKPNLGFVGTDTFSYKATDNALDSNEVIVTITVNHINHPVQPSDDSYTTAQNSLLTVSAANGVLVNDLDFDGDVLTVANISSDVSHGVLQANPDGSFTYAPTRGYSGLDSFTYIVTDGAVSSAPVTVNLTVTQVNHPPRAQSDSHSIASNTVLQVSAAQGVLSNDSDPELNLMSAILVSNPQHGLLHLEKDGSFNYTPANGYAGQDSFYYKATDGALAGNTVKVTINVNGTNSPPIADDDSYTISTDSVLQVNAANGLLVNDSDPDGDQLRVLILTQPQEGILHQSINGGFSYQPRAGYSGPDSFSYRVNDGSADSNPATVTLEIHATNHPPVTTPKSYTLTQGEVLQVNAPGLLGSATDPDGDQLKAILITGPTHGSVHLNLDGSFTYTPSDASYIGQDSFTYAATDGQLNSSDTDVQINIQATPPPAKPIPTLSQWAVILLSMLMLVVAGKVLRRVE